MEGEISMEKSNSAQFQENFLKLNKGNQTYILSLLIKLSKTPAKLERGVTK